MASAVPGLLMLLLQIGIGLGILAAIAGIVLAVRSPAESTPMRDRAAVPGNPAPGTSPLPAGGGPAAPGGASPGSARGLECW